MKTLTIILFLIAFNASGQSFYHKRMKKIDDRPATYGGNSLKQNVFGKFHSKLLYARKRHEYKKRRI